MTVAVKPGSGIHVTLVLPQRKIPVWLLNVLTCLREADENSLTVDVLTTEQWPRGRSPRLLRAWKWLDFRAFRRKEPDAKCTECLVDIDGQSNIEVDRNLSTSTLDNLVERIGRDKTDVIIWMPFDRPPSQLMSASTFGVWTLANAHNPAFGFRELVDRVPVTACEILKYGAAPDEDSCIATTFAATDRLFLSRGIIGLRAKSQALLLSTLRRLHRRHESTMSRLTANAPVTTGHRSPGLLLFVWGLAKLYGRYCIDVLKRPFFFDQWQLAYRVGGNRLDQKGLNRLAPAHRGFWADPFVAKRNGRTFVFFEEFLQETARGHISAIEVYADGSAGEPINVLQTEHHLSYPFLFEYNDSLFMIPECAESGRVEVFRSTRFPDRWESHAVLLDGVRAFDPTLVEHDGRWWMFVTIQHDGNSTDDELHLFYASGPFDDWTPHPLNPIRLDVRSARPAGALFREQGQLFRPAQDCSVRYGYAISIQKILRMTPHEYEEEEVDRIFPNWASDAKGTHTINRANGVTVYDCEARCRR